MKVYLKRDVFERALAQRNWSKFDFARVAGLARTHVSDLLSRRAAAGPRTREKILRALGGEFETFFEIVEEGGETME